MFRRLQKRDDVPGVGIAQDKLEPIAGHLTLKYVGNLELKLSIFVGLDCRDTKVRYSAVTNPKKSIGPTREVAHLDDTWLFGRGRDRKDLSSKWQGRQRRANELTALRFPVQRNIQQHKVTAWQVRDNLDFAGGDAINVGVDFISCLTDDPSRCSERPVQEIDHLRGPRVNSRRQMHGHCAERMSGARLPESGDADT